MASIPREVLLLQIKPSMLWLRLIRLATAAAITGLGERVDVFLLISLLVLLLFSSASSLVRASFAF